MQDLIIHIGINAAKCPMTIKPEHRLGPDGIGMDSMDILVFVAWLERDYNIEIPDEDWRKWETVQNVYDYLQAVK